jgi:hypothetical protein
MQTSTTIEQYNFLGRQDNKEIRSRHHEQTRLSATALSASRVSGKARLVFSLEMSSANVCWIQGVKGLPYLCRNGKMTIYLLSGNDK